MGRVMTDAVRRRVQVGRWLDSEPRYALVFRGEWVIDWTIYRETDSGTTGWWFTVTGDGRKARRFLSKPTELAEQLGCQIRRVQ